MKKYIKCFAFALIIPLLFLSGCFSLTFFDEGSTTTGYASVAGYKLCYKNNSYELDNTYEIYATHLLTELYANFGIVNDGTHTSKLTNKPTANEIKNYDRIRVQTQNDNTTTSVSWNWTFSTTLTGAESLTTDATDAQNYYAISDRQTAYYNQFVNAYKTALEVVLIQISMGITPNIYTTTLSSTETKVFLGADEITAENQTILSSVKTEFATKGQYVGLTTENVATLKDYILTKIIGTQITSAYNSILVNGTTKSYATILDEILTTDATNLTKSIFKPYPTANIKDITNSNLYVSKNGSAPLGHIEAIEYQSFVIMANSPSKIYSMSLALESEYAMEIEIIVSFYNATTNTRTDCSSPYNVSVPAGTWSASNLPYLTFESTTIPKWDNTIGENALSASTPKTINNENKNNTYYTINENKIGILDGENVGQSYFEISFKINKDSSRDYYPFKIGIQSLMVG